MIMRVGACPATQVDGLDVGPEKPLAPLTETGRQLGAAGENARPNRMRTPLSACSRGRPGASAFVSRRGSSSAPAVASRFSLPCG